MLIARSWLLAAFFLIPFAGPCWTARVELEDGSTYEGNILTQDTTDLFLEAQGKVLTFKRSRIRAIDGNFVTYTPAASSEPKPELPQAATGLSEKSPEELKLEWEEYFGKAPARDRLETVRVENSPYLFYKTEIHGGITLWGQADFLEQVKNSLDLLNSKTPEAFQEVASDLKRIQQGSKTSMHRTGNPPYMELNYNTAFRSPQECAMAIVHEACHAGLHNERRKDPSAPASSGQKAELACIGKEIDILRRLGGSEEDFEYLRSLDGLHADVNKDGKVNAKDRELQTW